MTLLKPAESENLSPIDPELGLLGDTDLESAQAEIARLSKKLDLADKAIKDLSHEMKTPLNAVIGFAQAMKAETFGPISPKYLEYATHIGTSGDHLLNLVTTILELAKLDAGKRALERVDIEPAKIARECFDMVRQASQHEGLSFSFEASEDLPNAWIDSRALRQILINLLSNAVKFTSDGGIKMHVDATDTHIVFVVEDTGIGMSTAHLASIGERFSNAQADGVRGAGGTGLGLSLAVELANLHEGSIDLISAPGEGVIATVALPIGTAIARRASREEGDNVVQSQLDRIEAYRKERRMTRQTAA